MSRVWLLGPHGGKKNLPAESYPLTSTIWHGIHIHTCSGIFLPPPTFAIKLGNLGGASGGVKSGKEKEKRGENDGDWQRWRRTNWSRAVLGNKFISTG